MALTPDDSEAHNNLGMALMQGGEGDASVMEFQAALKLRLDDTGIRGNLGIAYLEKSELDRAVRELREALKASPEAADLHYH